MLFHANDIMDVTNALEDYEVVFLAAFVGIDKERRRFKTFIILPSTWLQELF